MTVHSSHDIRSGRKKFWPYDDKEYSENLEVNQAKPELVLTLKDESGEKVELTMVRKIKIPYGGGSFTLTGTTSYNGEDFNVEASVYPHHADKNVVELRKTINLAL